MQVIGQAAQESIESGGVDLPDGPCDLSRVGGMVVAQPNDGRAVQATRREVGVARLDQFVPIALLLVQLGADSADEMAVVIW